MSANKKSRREKLFAKQEGMCPYCDIAMAWEEATLDHVIPTSKGGTMRLSNVLVVHRACNVLKAHFSSYSEAESYTVTLLAFFRRLKNKGIVS